MSNNRRRHQRTPADVHRRCEAGQTAASPLTRRLFGPELDRPTERNVESAGRRMTEVGRRGIWREIIATPAHP
jgi:hypothetical protein